MQSDNRSPAPSAARAVCSLRKALAYTNPVVLSEFREKYRVSQREAEDLFRETKRWLWLIAVTVQERNDGASPPPLELPQSLMLMDEMWHTFVLFTKPYTDYCLKNFGFYIHHYPTTALQQRAFAAEVRTDPKGLAERQRRALVAQYRYIHDKLGRRTLLKWHSESKRKYTPEFIERVANPGFLLRKGPAASGEALGTHD